MKTKSIFGLFALMVAMMISCNKNPQNVDEPKTVSPCAVFIGDCGDKPDWTKPMGIPARVTDEEPGEMQESLMADCMGENQLRIIWMKKDQCVPQFDARVTLVEKTITLICEDTASLVADCECVFPLYFDFDSLAYGTYSVVAGGVTHEIDFQQDMEPYYYEYE